MNNPRFTNRGNFVINFDNDNTRGKATKKLESVSKLVPGVLERWNQRS